MRLVFALKIGHPGRNMSFSFIYRFIDLLFTRSEVSRCVSLHPLRQHAYVLLLTDASWESRARARADARVSLQGLNFDQVRQIVTPTAMPNDNH